MSRVYNEIPLKPRSTKSEKKKKSLLEKQERCLLIASRSRSAVWKEKQHLRPLLVIIGITLEMSFKQPAVTSHLLIKH